MKYLLTGFFCAWMILYILGWIFPATIDNIATIGRTSILALVLISGHMAFDHYKKAKRNGSNNQPG